MLRRVLAATTSLVVAAALLLVASPAAADPPPPNSNQAAYWETPGTSEECAYLQPGGTTWTLPATPPAGSVWTKVIVKSGSTGESVDAENNAYYDDATFHYPASAPGTTWNAVADLQSTTFSHPSGKTISHLIYCWAPAPPTEVSGSASATNQDCAAAQLVGGVITVVITPGVAYTITGPSGAVPFDAVTGMTAGLPPGSYTVALAATTGYVLTGPASIPLTINPYGEICDEDPTPVTPTASATDQTCVDDESLVGGVITVGSGTGIDYTITGPSGNVPFDATTRQTAALPPGSYTVTAVAQSGYVLSGPSSIPLTIDPYGDDCGDDDPTPVTPSASATDQTCSQGVLLVGGVITVGSGEGIEYTITGPSGVVPFDAVTRQTGQLPPGTYTISVVAKAGFVLTSSANLVRTIAAYSGDCGLITKPLVVPAAVSTAITCESSGSYTLSTDQPGQAAVLWTVNGAPAADGVFVVAAPGVYNVSAAPAPGFGFGQGVTTAWTFTFTDPADCELTTLALTGSHGAAGYAGLVAVLGLLGAALVRAGHKRHRVA